MNTILWGNKNASAFPSKHFLKQQKIQHELFKITQKQRERGRKTTRKSMIPRSDQVLTT